MHAQQDIIPGIADFSTSGGDDITGAVGRRSSWRRQLKLLEEITLYLGRVPDPQEALEGLVRRIAAGTDCEVCSLYSYDAETEALSLAATYGLPARSIGRVHMRPSEGLVGLVVQEQKPVSVEDALAHPRFKFFPELGEEIYHSFLGVPVGEGVAAMGVLVLQSRRRRRFGEAEVSLLRSVAVQIRSLMHNAHLAERLQREEEARERYRREMSDAISRLEAYERREQAERAEGLDGDFIHLQGHGASPGFGVGRVHRIEPPADITAVEMRPGESPERELARFEKALAASVVEIEEARRHMRALVPEVGGAMFEALRMIIEDRSFAKRVHEEIAKGSSAEWALRVAVDEYVARFRAMRDEYLRERAVDVRDAGQRVLRHLLGIDEEVTQVRPDTVLVASELTLSDLGGIEHASLRGIVTAAGGVTSHAAILAKSLGIPTVVGADGVFEACCERDVVIVDGNTGTVYVRPGEDLLSEYQRLDEEYRRFQQELEHIRDLPAETTDGHRVAVLANIGLVGELMLADRYGAEGVGLYRTEFPFLSYRDFPSEEEQLALYREVIEHMGARPVTIRTLDLGADKYPSFVARPVEHNPFLGWRSIRVSLELEKIFAEQLRAILRAAGDKPLRVMFPMITSVEEIRRAREIYSECLSDLAGDGVTLGTDIELGAMIEVPAAVLRAPQIMREVDFVSIGTNDLIQYTLCVDRDNRKVASMYEPLHPAVLQSVRMVVDAAHAAGRRVGMCGEMAGNPLCTAVLLGMGLDELSMGPIYVPLVKKIIRAMSIEDARRIADEVLRYDTVQEIKGYLFAQLRDLGLIELVEAMS